MRSIKVAKKLCLSFLLISLFFLFGEVQAQKLVLSNPVGFKAGESALYTVSYYNSSNNLANIPDNKVMPINLASTGVTGGDGTFYKTDGTLIGNGKNDLEIPSGSSSVSFVFKATKSGTYTIEATTNGNSVSNGTDGIVVDPASVSKLTLNSPADFTFGNRAKYTVTRQDQYGNNITTGKTIVSLSATLNGTFYDASTGGNAINNTIEITDGNSSVDFYFGSEISTGSFTIDASSGELTPARDVIKIIEPPAVWTSEFIGLDNESYDILTTKTPKEWSPILYNSTNKTTTYTWKFNYVSGVGISHFDLVGFGNCASTTLAGKIQVQTSIDGSNWSNANYVIGKDDSQNCYTGSDVFKIQVSSPSGAKTMYYRLIISGGYYPPALQSNVVLRTGGGNNACQTLSTFIPTCENYCSLSAQATGSTVCAGGTATLNGTPSPAGTYNYTWSGPNGYSSSSLSSLISNVQSANAGTYTLTVTESATGCNATATATVVVNTLPTSSVDVPSIACNGGTTTITITGSGGTGPYQYSINAGGYKDPSNVFTGVYAGSYSVTVTDANGCSSTVTDVLISQPAVLTASATPGTISCYGGTTTINVTATGGILGTYSGTGNYTVSAGGYSYTVTDGNGCSSTVTGTVVEPDAVTVKGVDVPSIACNGGTTTITITGSGGTGPYQYSINAGSFKQKEDFFVTGAGSYSVTVTDANGCSSTVTDVLISQPAVLTASASGTEILCNGGNSMITVSGNGGTAPYTGTGTYTVTAGTHQYTITDANGCSATTSVTVTEPSKLSISISKMDVTCYDANAGSITAAVSGGTPHYSWSGGGATGTGLTFTKSGLSQGTYTYTVTDGNNCSTSTSVIISQPSNCAYTFTVSQGFYGSTSGTKCINGSGNKKAVDLIKCIMTTPSVKIMILGNPLKNKSFTLTVSDAAALNLIMPGGGTAAVLGGNYNASSTKPPLKNGKINNVLLSQTITMWLNINMPGNNLKNWPLVYVPGAESIAAKARNITMVTIEDLVNAASKALGGDPITDKGYSLSDLVNALDACVKKWDNSIAGASACSYSLINVQPGSSYSRLIASESDLTSAANPIQNAAVNTIETKVYPNPYIDKVSIRVTSSQAGKASLILYNMSGQRVATIFEGEMKPGTQTFNYTVPVTQRRGLIYIFRQNGQAETGQIFGLK